MRTVDTNAVVICVACVFILNVEQQWVAFGKGKDLRYIHAHSVADSPGIPRTLAVPFCTCLQDATLHVSSFCGVGQKTSSDVW